MQPETIVTASKLLERAAEAGVFLSHSQERLHFKLTVNAFPEDLKREILANKAALIAFLSQRESNGDGALNLPRIVPRPRETNEIEASFAQQRLWFIDQMDGASRQYHMPAAMHVRGRFDEDVAEQSLRSIIERHESLRTTFINGEDAPLQQIQTSFDFHLTRIDLSGAPRDAQEHAIDKARKADAEKPFDLKTDLM